MKNLVALFCVAAAFSAFAEGESNLVESGNTLGILRVDLGDVEEAIIAVPWLEPGGANIAATSLIKTANLSEGDQLYYYNTEKKAYEVWQLNASKQWEAAQNVGGDNKVSGVSTVTPNADLTFQRGNAILLKRPGTKESAIYLYGQVASTSEATITLATATSEVPAAYTLLAPPGVTAYNLNAATWSGTFGVNDCVIIGDRAPLRYNATENKWGHYKLKNFKKEWSYDAADIPAGQGAWFVSRTVGGTAPSVKWSGLPSVGTAGK